MKLRAEQQIFVEIETMWKMCVAKYLPRVHIMRWRGKRTFESVLIWDLCEDSNSMNHSDEILTDVRSYLFFSFEIFVCVLLFSFFFSLILQNLFSNNLNAIVYFQISLNICYCIVKMCMKLGLLTRIDSHWWYLQSKRNTQKNWTCINLNTKYW